MEKIKCPCCGGETSNFLNCDYCGSYLVRFSTHNIPLDINKYGPNAYIIKDIQDALSKNIEEQILTKSCNHICTRFRNDKNNLSVEIMNPRSIGDVYHRSLGDKSSYLVSKNPFDAEEIAVVLVLRYYEFTKQYMIGESKYTALSQFANKQKMDWIKHSGIEKLLLHVQDNVFVPDSFLGKCLCHSYYLNFGRDYVGASSVITQYLTGVNNYENSKISIRHESFTESQYQSQLSTFRKELNPKSVKLISITIFVIGLALVLFASDIKPIAWGVTFCLYAVYVWLANWINTKRLSDLLRKCK